MVDKVLVTKLAHVPVDGHAIMAEKVKEAKAQGLDINLKQAYMMAAKQLKIKGVK